MPRARTGTLIYKRTTGWNARVWTVVRDEDGTERDERRWVPLETHDKDLAKRKLAKIVGMLASGELVADAAKAEAARVETVAESAREWCKRRRASGVAMADTELGYFEHHLLPELGMLAVTDVRKTHIKSALRTANGKGLSKGTIGHLRRLLFRFFKSLEVDEIIPANPVRLVSLGDLGRMKQDKRPFTQATDEEVTATFESPAVDVEIKLVILVARMLGGQRGAEVNRWTWDMIDRDSFAACVIQRAKGDDVQPLGIPERLRPFLRAWWEGNGAPSSGPVFPVARGIRRGEARGKTSYAVRVRRAFWKAGQRRNELHNETPHSRPLNFHTMGRRAFVSALASSGANEQTAMALAHHADSRIHKRYQLSQIVDVPAAALPALGTASPEGWVTAVSKRSRRAIVSVERDTGFEPATSSLGSWHSTN